MMTGNLETSGVLTSQTPNVGTTGGLRIKANSTSGLAILQFIDAAASQQYGYLTVGVDGILHWSGNPLYHTGNLPSLISSLMSNGIPKMVTGSYVGAGTYGSGSPNSLTFGFAPN